MSGCDVTVYWRPGCGFCSSLLRGLERAGVVFDRVDIWEDAAAADFVRGVAGGNETVPTVRIRDVALVNPTVRDVLREVAPVPTAVPPGRPSDGGGGRTPRAGWWKVGRSRPTGSGTR